MGNPKPGRSCGTQNTDKFCRCHLSIYLCSGNPGSADGQGTAARFQNPMGLVVNNDGCVIVADCHSIWSIAAGLSPPVGSAMQLRPAKRRKHSEDMGLLLMDPALADVTFLVHGERITAHRNILAARSD
jgi:hypothetical protein